jgi:hypothetical protein
MARLMRGPSKVLWVCRIMFMLREVGMIIWDECLELLVMTDADAKRSSRSGRPLRQRDDKEDM